MLVLIEFAIFPFLPKGRAVVVGSIKTHLSIRFSIALTHILDGLMN